MAWIASRRRLSFPIQLLEIALSRVFNELPYIYFGAVLQGVVEACRGVERLDLLLEKPPNHHVNWRVLDNLGLTGRLRTLTVVGAPSYIGDVGVHTGVPPGSLVELFRASQYSLSHLDVTPSACERLEPLPGVSPVLAKLPHLALDLRMTPHRWDPRPFLLHFSSLRTLLITFTSPFNAYESIIGIIKALPLPGTLLRLGLIIDEVVASPTVLPTLHSVFKFPQLENLVSVHLLERYFPPPTSQSFFSWGSRVDPGRDFLRACEERGIGVTFGALQA